MIFYLGTHMPNWLEQLDIPLFVCRNRLAGRRTFPRAIGPWALDSGGFTELKDHGSWRIDAKTYAADVRRFRDEIGNMAWAAPMDWMCEPAVINGGRIGPLRFVGTGLSVAEHQRNTVDNYLRLRDLAPDLPFRRVVQGWTLDDYRRCVDLYDKAGEDLADGQTVGIGSVCRRQHTGEINHIVSALAADGIRLHGFGVKVLGLGLYGRHLASADSLAWSFDARRAPRLAECAGSGHRNCANCSRYALRWREKVLSIAS